MCFWTFSASWRSLPPLAVHPQRIKYASFGWNGVDIALCQQFRAVQATGRTTLDFWGGKESQEFRCFVVAQTRMKGRKNLQMDTDCEGERTDTSFGHRMANGPTEIRRCTRDKGDMLRNACYFVIWAIAIIDQNSSLALSAVAFFAPN